MELYGFPVASERRTSAALFARRLHKMGEKFLIRALGQSDRTLTTIWSNTSGRPYPRVEKVCLIALDEDQAENMDDLEKNGYFVDPKKRVVILRVKYNQHTYNPDNVRQDRALSVEAQELIHPESGAPLTNVNIIKDSTNMFLRLNDIVRGEYHGYIIYKRNELVENTNTEEKKLKFLYAWLSKHQHRIIGYSDDFFKNVSKVLDTYLFSVEHYSSFAEMNEFYQEVFSKYSYIQQARKLKLLEDLFARNVHGKRIGYGEMLDESIALLQSLKFEIVNYFDSLVDGIINIGENMLNDRYLCRNYINKKTSETSARQQAVRRSYGRMVALIDEFKAIRRTRKEIKKNPINITN
jgi:hypothetical protein